MSLAPTRIRTNLLLATAAGVLSAMPTQALAQVSDQSVDPQAEVGEILVTAQRREQSVQDVGISVTAFSGDSLSNLGVVSTQGIAAHVPGLLFDSGDGGVNAFVSIRGVSQVDFAEHQEGPNAVYLDEVYVPTPSMVNFPLYDMARAEALRGPQGTLFGRNSTGGLLQFVTRDPSVDSNGFLDASYSRFNNVRLEGAVGGVISEGVNFRLAGFYNRADGWFKNTLPGFKNSNETQVFGIRAKVAAELGGGWTAKVTGSLNRAPKHREGVYKTAPVYPDANGVTQFLPANLDYYGTGPGNDPLGYRDGIDNFHTGAFNSEQGFLEKQYTYGTLKLEGPVGSATLTSITNYSVGKVDFSSDTDSTPNDVVIYAQGGRTRQFTEELRLSGRASSLLWIVGGYFQHSRGTYYSDFNLVAPQVFGPFRAYSPYSQRTQSYAVFAHGEYSFNDQFKLTVGARYTHDTKSFRSQVFDTTTGTPYLYYEFSEDTVGNLARLSHGDWTGKIQLDYEPSRDVLIYLGISRGYRSGGFNATVDGTLPLADTPFKHESIIDYEGGVKLSFLDRKASLRLSAFYYDYTDYQAFNYSGVVGRVSNNPAYNYGGEAEFSIRPGSGFDIYLGAAYARGKVKNYSTLLLGVIDTDPVKAPKFTFNGIISKAFEIGDNELRLSYDFDYQGRHKSNLTPSPVTEISSSWMHNARASFGKVDGPWEAYVFVRNLSNTARRTFAYDTSYIGSTIQSYAQPRNVGAGIRMEF
jgi:iron complex outermembrane recepter protein